MQCGQCGFENLPGLSTCIRCGSILQAAQAMEVHPPRAGWTKTFRPAYYRFNRVLGFSIPHLCQRIFGKFFTTEVIGSASPLNMLLSIVPGLGHLPTGKFKERWRYIAAYYGVLFLGLLLFGTVIGGMAIGVAAALHAWIMCDAAGIRQPSAMFQLPTLTFALVFILVLFALYGGIRESVSTVFRGVYAGDDIPFSSVSQGDYLIARTGLPPGGRLHRGDIILYRTTTYTFPGYRVEGGDLVAPILGLPGETLEFAETTVIIKRDEKVVAILENQALGLGLGGGFVLKVPEDAYFCIPPQFNRYGNPLLGAPIQFRADILQRVGMAPVSTIQARAFFLYNPIWKRGFLRPDMKSAIEPAPLTP